jgi:hypothetical protein
MAFESNASGFAPTIFNGLADLVCVRPSRSSHAACSLIQIDKKSYVSSDTQILDDWFD